MAAGCCGWANYFNVGTTNRSRQLAVKWRNFEGVTHEFFGLGAVSDTAKAAEQFAADELKKSFAK